MSSKLALSFLLLLSGIAFTGVFVAELSPLREVEDFLFYGVSLGNLVITGDNKLFLFVGAICFIS